MAVFQAVRVHTEAPERLWVMRIGVVRDVAEGERRAESS
jgi:hypothetical protein